jgi:hypothetical protein
MFTGLSLIFLSAAVTRAVRRHGRQTEQPPLLGFSRSSENIIERCYQRLDQRPGGFTLLDGCRRDQHSQNQAQAAHRDVAFAPRNLLARIVAAFSGLIRCFDRLTIHDGGAGRHCPPFGLTHTVPQDVVGEGPSPVLAPDAEVAVDRGPRPKVTGQKPPGTPRPDHIEKGVEQTAAIQLNGSAPLLSPGFWGRHQRLNLVPFFISQVCSIATRMRLHPSHL